MSFKKHTVFICFLLNGGMAISQSFVNHRTFFYEAIQAFNMEPDVDSVVIRHKTKAMNWDNADDNLNVYRMGASQKPLKFYLNRFGRIDSFKTYQHHQYTYIKNWKIIRFDESYSDSERVVARYDSFGNLLYGHIDDRGIDLRYPDIITHSLTNTFDVNGRLIQAMSEDSTFRKRIFYYEDSIVELFDNLKAQPKGPVLDKVFRGNPGGLHNFFDWSPTPIKRVKIFSGKKLVRQIEAYAYYNLETAYVYDKKGRMKKEISYMQRQDKVPDEYCIKTYTYSLFGNLSRLEVNYPRRAMVSLNYHAVNNTITQRIRLNRKYWRTNNGLTFLRLKLVYKLYR
jgi:hypothetical protein